MDRPFVKWMRVGAVAMALGWLGVGPTWGRWMAPTDMPVSRLLTNVRAYIKAHPKEANGYYTLGRINSAAFAQDSDTIGVYTRDTLPSVPTYSGLTPRPRDRVKPLSPQTLIYLSDAIANYKKATALNSSDGLAWLGLGFQCEETLPFPQAVGKASAALGLRGRPNAEQIRQQALRSYRKAYALTLKTDSGRSGGLIAPVSVEAAQGIVRLQKDRQVSSAEQTELTEMQERIKTYKSQPRAVTPILISLDPKASLPDLLSPEKHVRFDLAGDGLKREWPWVKPTTGILVWDPNHTGKITSGLQMFGSVTWWLFWKDGYEPLAALDNNRNGWLEGTELAGISVWFDRNSNGVADQGEVVSLSSLGIKRIAAQSAGIVNGVSANPDGVQLRDGSSLATFDWTPTSLAN
jgi:hypothetical protein